ncbi:hypothetical protein SAMN04488063_3676 [Halopelagius inordinatus]|uniref:Uncharacterized protein n=1 Tax=Halopelagius inordinatus TaxID=553467 RepID=A0A1I2WSH6_9EURY|nr:hypothetical protein [Halopelagius inordinatus]SFH04245.1 hypothetical protein SAMN04488063_3676 [Halopelagius inordinatus]
MQRRAAAIYVAFFLVIGAASYSLIATAQTPEIQFQNPDYSVSQGDTFDANGQTYNVSSISATEEEGGHGGGATLVRSGEMTYTEQSAEYTETWENNSSVTVGDGNWTVLVPEDSNASQFTLRQDVDRTQILEQDPNADNETVTRNGQEYVVQNEGGSTTLILADEYFPTPETRQVSVGESLQYQGNQTNVENVTESGVEVTWTAPRTNTIEASDDGNVTLGDQTYLAHFPDNETMQLTSDFENYQAQQEEIESFHTRENGLWGIVILCGSVVALLVGLAFLPSRY